MLSNGQRSRGMRWLISAHVLRGFSYPSITGLLSLQPSSSSLGCRQICRPMVRIVSSRLRSGLPSQSDALHRLLVRGEAQVAHAVKELEPSSAVQEHLVYRREYGLSHPGRHLPEDGAFVGKENAADTSERRSR